MTGQCTSGSIEFTNLTLLQARRTLDYYWITLCHKSQELNDKTETEDSILYMIPSHHTGLLQICDAGINKSLEDRLRKSSFTWRCNRHAKLASGQKNTIPETS